MARLLTDDVFKPNAYPDHTYVQRDSLHHEKLIQEWAMQSNQIASVSGPSKAGKTVLVQRVIGQNNLVTVSGATVRTADQLWERVLDWYGEPHATTASTITTDTDTTTREHAGQLGVAGTSASHRRAAGEAHAVAETVVATVNRRGLPQVVAELSKTTTTILLDDFHYIPTAIQNDIAQQLKDAASRGVRICVASIPHRADDVVRALPELRGRVLSIDLDYWSRRDLLQIPQLGLPLLNLEIDHATLNMFATEAAGSPQLMQTICQWASKHVGVREALDEPRAVTLDETGRKEVLFVSSCAAEHRTLVRALISGPKVKSSERRNYIHFDGRSGDVYLTIMRAIAMEPKLAIAYSELQDRLEKLCNGATPDGASVVNACTRIGQIALGHAPATGPELEWDDHTQTMVIHDPYLMFYLRWSVMLEREADALL